MRTAIAFTICGRVKAAPSADAIPVTNDTLPSKAKSAAESTHSAAPNEAPAQLNGREQGFKTKRNAY